MNLAGLDLNLLVVFDALMAERHVTRAGNRIGMSQSAVSKALNRLRHHLKDDLFIRSSDGMIPTQRATDIAPEISQALRLLESSLDVYEFDPATARRSFTILTNDLIASTLIPDLISYLDTFAPGIDLRLLPTTGNSPELLEKQSADFSITPLLSLPPQMEAVPLLNSHFVVLMRKDHPLCEGELTPQRLVTARHVMVSIRGDDRSKVDLILEDMGLSRRVGITINQFQVGPRIVSQSDLIMIAPESLARHQAALLDLEIRPVPFELPEFFGDMRLVWSRRQSNNPASAWMRNTIIGIANRTINSKLE